MSDGMIVTPFEHNDSFGYCDLGTLKTVVHIPTRYFNAMALISQFNTKNDPCKEFCDWKTSNAPRITALETYVKAYAEDELINHDDGSQSIMFSINHTSDLFKMDDTGKVISTKDKVTSLNENDTFNAIKGTYVHPILISYLLMYLDTTLESIHATMVRNNYKEQNFKRAVLDDRFIDEIELNNIKGTYVHQTVSSHLPVNLETILEGIHSTIIFNKYKEWSFKRAVLDDKLTPAQTVKGKTQLTNEINTCNAFITGCTVGEIEKDNTDYEAKYKKITKGVQLKK